MNILVIKPTSIPDADEFCQAVVNRHKLGTDVLVFVDQEAKIYDSDTPSPFTIRQFLYTLSRLKWIGSGPGLMIYPYSELRSEYPHIVADKILTAAKLCVRDGVVFVLLVPPVTNSVEEEIVKDLESRLFQMTSNSFVLHKANFAEHAKELVTLVLKFGNSGMFGRYRVVEGVVRDSDQLTAVPMLQKTALL